MLVRRHIYTINYSSCGFFLFRVIQFPCHLISPCYFYTTSLSHRTVLFRWLIFPMWFIKLHSYETLWDFNWCLVKLHTSTLLWFPTSASFRGYFQLGSEIPVQEKPTIFWRMTSVIKPSNQGLEFVSPPSLLFQWALGIQHPLTSNGFARLPMIVLLWSES